jgi:hypothetical protein
MIVQKIELTDTLEIYKARYDWRYSKEDIIHRIKQNNFLLGLTDVNTTEIKVRSEELDYISNLGYNIAKALPGLPTNWNGSWVTKTWSYIQRPDSIAPSQDWHSHNAAINFPDSNINAPILTDWTYCFYVKIPKDLQGVEGALSLIDQKGKVVNVIPQEGDILFFKGNVKHKPVLSPSSKEERIALCSNISFNTPRLI